jgi:hypothetical protein
MLEVDRECFKYIPFQVTKPDLVCVIPMTYQVSCEHIEKELQRFPPTFPIPTIISRHYGTAQATWDPCLL